MCIFDLFKRKKQEETTQVVVEVLKGQLAKSAVLDCIRTQFSEDEGIIESVFIEEDKSNKELISKAKTLLNFEIKYTKDYNLSFLIFSNDKGTILKLCAIISEGLDVDLSEIMRTNNNIMRIKRKK